jgi:hypothetical protein
MQACVAIFTTIWKDKVRIGSSNIQLIDKKAIVFGKVGSFGCTQGVILTQEESANDWSRFIAARLNKVNDRAFQY